MSPYAKYKEQGIRIIASVIIIPVVSILFFVLVMFFSS